jgi:hypothetical protein
MSNYSNVRKYTADQILERVSQAEGFIGFPPANQIWVVWVRSEEDETNVFDDKAYVFRGQRFQFVAPCTTNAGIKGLKNFEEYNKDGVALLEDDIIIYNSHSRGLHRGKVEAYRQAKPWPYYRDYDKDDKIEKLGDRIEDDVIHANIHPATYNKGDTKVKKWIGGWSLACLVFAKRLDFDKLMEVTKKQRNLTNCILKEWNPENGKLIVKKEVEKKAEKIVVQKKEKKKEKEA